MLPRREEMPVAQRPRAAVCGCIVLPQSCEELRHWQEHEQEHSTDAQPAVWERAHAGPSRRLFHPGCGQSVREDQTMACAHPEPSPDLAAGCAAPRDAAARSHIPKDRRTIGRPHRRSKARVAGATCVQATTLLDERRTGFRPSSESGSRDNRHGGRAPAHAQAPPPTVPDSEPSAQTQAI